MSGSNTQWVQGAKPTAPPSGRTVTVQLHAWTTNLVGPLALQNQPGTGAAPTGPAVGGGTAWTPGQATANGAPRVATTPRVPQPTPQPTVQPPPVVDHAQVWAGRAQELATARATAQQLKGDGDPTADGLLTDLSGAEGEGQAARFQEAGTALDAARPKVEARAKAWPLVKRAKASADKASAAGLDLGGQRETLRQEVATLAEGGQIEAAATKAADLEALVKAAVGKHFQDGLTAATDPAGASPTQSQAIEALRKKLRDEMPPTAVEIDVDRAKKALADLTSAIETAKQANVKRTEAEAFKTGGSKFAELTGTQALTGQQKTKIDALVAQAMARHDDASIKDVDVKKIAQDAVTKVQKLAKTKLGAEVNGLVDASPTFKNAIFEMNSAKNCEIVLQSGTGNIHFQSSGAAGAGGTIRLDTDLLPRSVDKASALAHETGHAQNNIKGRIVYPDAASLTKPQWITASVEKSLRDEGEATMFALGIRQEILDNGGADIEVEAGSDATKAQYIAIWNEHHANRKTHEQAVSEIAEIFRGAEGYGPRLTGEYTAIARHPSKVFKT